MNELPEWHPMAVHFPLALVVTGAVALSAAPQLPKCFTTVAFAG